MQASRDAEYMARALRLAHLGLPTTHPNPRVGCVVVADGEFVGEGWHEKAGGPHGEIVALGEAGQRARGATVYLNLEPCCHQGRTPPCTDALIDAGVARVVAAMEDPNPRVAGGGFEILRGAGIEVDVGLMRDAAAALNRGFVSRMTRGRPWVTVKIAASIDGRTAMADGESRWITSEASRADVHRTRARVSAVMTGSGTALADDPALTARCEGVTRQPMRVLVDGRTKVPKTARLFEDSAQVVVATAGSVEAPSYDAHVEFVSLPGGDGRVDLGSLMDHLGDREVNDLLVEAGASLTGALLKNGLVDEIVLYLAPTCLGSDARGMFDLPFVTTLDERIPMRITDIRQTGPDIKVTALVTGK
ncbi:MAG: bifunctional diaminohydroxyphosphoribosylaminopyrimidine deaminase/5-amino-6-(5-phosphoribosylamino)uracil reductase RibD [Arenicellales bacterium]